MAHDKQFMTRYIVIWVCVAIIGVVFIFLMDAKKANIECVDGTFVTDKSACLQCTIDLHCGTNKVCRENTCVTKACLTDEDCDTAQSACIFEKCVISAGKVI